MKLLKKSQEKFPKLFLEKPDNEFLVKRWYRHVRASEGFWSLLNHAPRLNARGKKKHMTLETILTEKKF